MISNTYLEKFKSEFEVNKEKMLEIADYFRKTMEDGLEGKKSPLKMLPSFIGKPSGNEKGIFYTVDMGGTNVRSTKFSIENRKFDNLGESKSRLKDPNGSFDYTDENTTAEILFDFFAQNTAKLVEPLEKGYLGHTFSFPSKQTGINDAALIEWTKEIKVTGVVGNNPNTLLHEALKRKNIQIEPVAIINDTVGTLLVAQYLYEDADIGVIMGTGHNTCYLENKHPLTGGEMIVNMESGNFNVGLPLTVYDREVDQNSVAPGAQMLEKMVSGYYMGEIATAIVEDFYKNGALFSGNESAYNRFKSKKIESLDVENYILYPDKTKMNLGCSDEDANVLKEISEALVDRTARLVVASLIGTLLRIESGNIQKKHTIAIDGTIFEKMPKVPDLMKVAFVDALGEKADLIDLKLVKDGSGLGAAIAAAIAVKNRL